MACELATVNAADDSFLRSSQTAFRAIPQVALGSEELSICSMARTGNNKNQRHITQTVSP
jgi:hypothetical protein